MNHLKITHKMSRNIPRKQDFKELLKTAILGSAHILWNVLMEVYNRFNMENTIKIHVPCIVNTQ